MLQKHSQLGKQQHLQLPPSLQARLESFEPDPLSRPFFKVSLLKDQALPIQGQLWPCGSSSPASPRTVLEVQNEAGEKALAALAGDPSLVPSIPIKVAHNHLQLQFQGPKHPLPASVGTGRHITYPQNRHLHMHLNIMNL